jgi:hypothetical protein
VELQKFPPSVTVIIMEASVVSVMDIMEAALVMGIMGEEGRLIFFKDSIIFVRCLRFKYYNQ